MLGDIELWGSSYRIDIGLGGDNALGFGWWYNV